MKKNAFPLKVLLISFLTFISAQFIRAQYDDYMKIVASPPTTSFIMYADNAGNLYYVNIEDGYLDLMKYDLEHDSIYVVSEDFTDQRYENNTVYNTGFGAVATTPDRDTVYCMTTAGTNHGGAEIFRLICSEDKFEYITTVCGTNYWMLWNLSLSPDGKYLYYIANNTSSGKSVCRISLETKECEQVLDLDPIITDKDLCFGGINVWDKQNNFYVPVWSYQKDDNDCSLLQVNTGGEEVTAELKLFTDDMTEFGDPLFPDFRHESCWDAICASSKGDIYICVSNHYKPTNETEPHGNVAIYKYDPVADEMSLIGDIKSVSESVDNWMEHESQYKVHTFMIENSDGKIYFATGDHDPTYFLRGSHVYTIDIETDSIEDYSKTQNYLMRQDLSVVENGSSASTSSGVFIEHYGIKGIALNPNSPENLYAMSWEMDGGTYLQAYIIKYTIDGVMSDVIPAYASDEQINVYPNPFSEFVNFDFSEIEKADRIKLKIYDIYGHLLVDKTISNTEVFRFELNEYSSNLFLYSIETNEKQFTGKLIRQ